MDRRRKVGFGWAVFAVGSFPFLLVAALAHDARKSVGFDDLASLHTRQIFTDIFLVSPHKTGSDHATPLCNTYLLDCGEALALIDPGPAADYDAVRTAIMDAGFLPDQVRWVVLTDAHADVAGSVGLWQGAGAEVAVHVAGATTVATAGPETLAAYWGVAFVPAPVTYALQQGDQLILGKKTLTVIHTPGHARESVVYHVTVGPWNVFFTGDTVLPDGRGLWFDVPGFDPTAYETSLRQLRGLEQGGQTISMDLLLPAHGDGVLAGGLSDLLACQRAYTEWFRNRSAP